MAQNSQVKNYFKAPEGRYLMHSERTTGCSFVPSRPVRLTFATVQHQGSTHNYLLYNILDALAFCFYASVDKPPTRQIFVGSGSPSHNVFPTCHDHHPSPDNMDLVVGLSTGDVVVGSVKAQLQASASNTKLLSLLHFNPEGAVDASRAVSVAWVPGTNASLFAAAHQSGSIYLYQPSAAASGEAKGKAVNGAPKPALTINVCSAGLTSMAVSPDGTKIASTSRDGVLYVHNLNTGILITGFKSYYAGLNCCAWSHDSLYIATGGEDDLVCVFGLTEQAVVMTGEGHSSWVTKVAFDRWESEQASTKGDLAASPSPNGATVTQQTRYRIASVGQDCQLLLWDFVEEEDDYLDLADASPNRSGKLETYPRAAQKPPPSSPAAPSQGAPATSRLGRAGLPAEIKPPIKRSEICFTTPVMAQAIHAEPCSDVLFMKEAMYTACYCGQIRCWRRPEKLTPEAERQLSRSTSDASEDRRRTGESRMLEQPEL